MPFKNKEEKRQFILEHRILFEKLNIELTEEKIKELVDAPDNEEEYRRAAEIHDRMKKREEESEKFFGPTPELSKYMMARVPRYLYDISGTPEAQVWNQQLKEIVEGPDAVRKLTDMCVKKLLDFDDSIMTKSTDELEKYVNEHFEESAFHFVIGDVVRNMHKVYNMNDPKEAAIVRAAQDKYVTSQTIESLMGKTRYTSNKLSTVLPELGKLDIDALANALPPYISDIRLNLENDKELDEETKKRKLEEADEESKAILDGAFTYLTLKPQVERDNPGMKKLAEMNQIGEAGNYRRAYRETPKGKVYLRKDQVATAIATKKDGDIQYEEVSAEDKKAIDDFRNETRAIGSLGVFPNDEKKRQFFKTLQPHLNKGGYTLTDAMIDDIVRDRTKELEYLKNKDRRALLNQVENGFTVPASCSIHQFSRTVGGMHMRGDTEEAKQWNENINYMIQTPEGQKQVAAMAAKKLLSIDMSILTEYDTEKRNQYIMSHPLEGQLLFLAKNVTEAYETSLAPEERENNPILEVLATRKTLYEQWQRDKGRIMAETSRLLTFLPDKKEEAPAADKKEEAPVQEQKEEAPAADKKEEAPVQEQKVEAPAADKKEEAPVPKLSDNKLKMDMVQLSGVLRTDVAKDYSKDFPESPETLAIYQEVKIDLTALLGHHADLLEDDEKALLYGLYQEGKLGKEPLYERFYAPVNLHIPGKGEIKEGEIVPIGALAHAIATKQAKYDDFRRETMSDAEKEKINRFLAETPDEPTRIVNEDLKKELQQKIAIREIYNANIRQINGFVGKMNEKYPRMDREMRDLMDNFKEIDKPSLASEILEKAFRYVNDHKDHSIWTSNRDKLEIALTTIAALDGTCAKELVNRINFERRYGNAFKQPELNLDKILEKSGVKPTNTVEKEVFSLNNPYDKRVQNLKVIYEHLRYDLNPWHHFNSKSFDKMMDSMRLTLEYASTSKSIDSKIMENMLKEVKENTKTYMLEKDASKELGQNRKSAALAMLTALDPELGKEMINKVTEDKREWALAIYKKMNRTVTDGIAVEQMLAHEKLTVAESKQAADETAERLLDDIFDSVSEKLEEEERAQIAAEQEAVNKAEDAKEAEAKAKAPAAVVSKEELRQGEVPVPFNKEEILKQMMDDIKRTQETIQSPETSWDDTIDLTAQYMVKKRIYNSLKANVIDKDSIAVNMSKFQIKETSSKLIKDDVYQKVVNSLGIKIDNPEAVEREVIAAKVQEVEKKNEEQAKEKEKAEEALKEAQKEQKKENPEKENPVAAGPRK